MKKEITLPFSNRDVEVLFILTLISLTLFVTGLEIYGLVTTGLHDYYIIVTIGVGAMWYLVVFSFTRLHEYLPTLKLKPDDKFGAKQLG